MDEKHREYCIKLGNPYYIGKENKPQYEEFTNSSWDNFAMNAEESDTGDNWLKNSKKFTN